jgi:single-stranded-DNA-specific exonuclease
LQAFDWQELTTDANLDLMAETLGISRVTAHVMATRGLRSKNAALAFLQPCISRLGNPLTMKDAPRAIACIKAAIENGEDITVFGDYDADGIMSTVILIKTLHHLGITPSYYIPHRMDEGYGLNAKAVETLAEGGTQMLITVDNGIAAIEEITLANKLGISVVIIDHHEPGFTSDKADILPPAAAIVDPKQADCPYPFKDMCAAGLVYKLCTALAAETGNPLTPALHDELLALAAIATLCDIVDLVGENRIIVAEGLRVLNENKLINPGLGSLLTLRGLLEKPIGTFEVGFVIGPCLNATGRLESADIAVDLLLDAPQKTSDRLAAAYALLELNDSRKALTAECIERAMAQLPDPLPKILVLTDNEAHESVAGIVAGRVRDKTNRPTMVMTPSEESGQYKGSGRSIAPYDMFKAMYANRRLFTRFGGHAMAAGFTIPEGNIDALRVALNAECALTDTDFRPVISTDYNLQATEISPQLVHELARLAPFGKANPQPIFVTRGFRCASIRILDEKNTLIFQLSAGALRFKAIAFGLNEQFHAATKKTGGFTIDIAYILEENHWNGGVELQARIKDFLITED